MVKMVNIMLNNYYIYLNIVIREKALWKLQSKPGMYQSIKSPKLTKDEIEI